MTKTTTLLLSSALCLCPVVLLGQGASPSSSPNSSQGLDPATLTQKLAQPGNGEWATYAGDYSQRRFAPYTQINAANVKDLTLAWKSETLTAGPGGGGGGGMFFGRGGGGGAPTSIGGIATAQDMVNMPGSSSGTPRISGSPLEVNGIIYVSSPDNAWAVDARDGTVLWHYWWRSRGGTHIGNRGMAMYGDWLYLETPDDVLVSLDAKTGKERWHKIISDFDEHYFSTTAPVVVKNHLLVGTSDDLDAPGFIQSFDPVTGDLQWKHYNVPMAKGDPGADSWGTIDAAQHGGATYWMPGSYDPATNLYIFGTGNPIPAYSVDPRGAAAKDTDLYTCSIIALDVDTGKMKWYFQTSPDDTHDWDSSESPVLVDGTWDGQPRHMVMQAARNGYFYVLDRDTGAHLLTSRFSPAANWAAEINAQGGVVRNPEKDSTIAGSLVSPTNGGSTNWPPPTFDPQTGLFYVGLHQGYAMYYLTLKNTRLMMGLGGKEEDAVGSFPSSIAGIDYHTGKTVYNYEFPGGGPTGLLSTAGGLLFSGDGAGNLVAYDAKTPQPLWHSHIGQVGNAAETYMLDGTQYVLSVADGTLYAFSLRK